MSAWRTTPFDEESGDFNWLLEDVFWPNAPSKGFDIQSGYQNPSGLVLRIWTGLNTLSKLGHTILNRSRPQYGARIGCDFPSGHRNKQYPRRPGVGRLKTCPLFMTNGT
jgi:hypothetical protein